MKPSHFVNFTTLLIAAGFAYSIHAQNPPELLRSFVVTSVMSTPREGSPYLHTTTFARAVRDDGSSVTIWTTMIGGREQYERDIDDYRTGVSTIVDDATKSVVRQSIPESEYKHRLAPAASCDGAPAGEILGVSVNYTEIKRSITGGEQGEITAQIKSWAAPELGCLVLQKETIWTRDSDRFVLVNTKVTPISVSFRPVDEFFDIPTSYAARTKEEVLGQLNQLLSTTVGVP
jgi:hypothetical protein